MFRKFSLFFFVCFMVCIAVAAMAATVEIIQSIRDDELLARNYGWTLEMKHSDSDWSWDILCDPIRTAIPPEDGKMFRNFVCRHHDPRFLTTILWRLPEVPPEVLERLVFGDMQSSAVKYTAECVTETIDTPVGAGVIKDCKVVIANYLYNMEGFASFFHFNRRIPRPYVVETGGSTPKQRDELGFTIYVRNAAPRSSTPDVAKKLRAIVKTIKTVK